MTKVIHSSSLFFVFLFLIVYPCFAIHYSDNDPNSYSSRDPSPYPYPCPTPPPPGERVSGAFDWHHDFQNEWYYVSGSLIAMEFRVDGSYAPIAPMGYQISTTMYNTTGAQLTTENNIAVSSQAHFSAEGMGPATFGLFDLSFSSSAMTTSYIIQKGVPGEIGSIYVVKAENANMSIALTLTAMAPLMYQGDGGYYGYSPSGNTSCPAYYYVTIPRLWTTGTIQLNNITHQVTGYSWFDHEWGGAFPGWYWLGVNIGSYSIMITVPRINGTNRYEYSIMDVQDMNGTMSQAKITHIEVLSNWTSPSTSVVYPTEIRLFSTHPAFTSFSTVPFYNNQEAGPILHFWEGDVKVMVDSGTAQASQGVGYLELMGFTADKKEEEDITIM